MVTTSISILPPKEAVGHLQPSQIDSAVSLSERGLPLPTRVEGPLEPEGSPYVVRIISSLTVDVYNYERS